MTLECKESSLAAVVLDCSSDFRPLDVTQFGDVRLTDGQLATVPEVLVFGKQACHTAKQTHVPAELSHFAVVKALVNDPDENLRVVHESLRAEPVGQFL